MRQAEICGGLLTEGDDRSAADPLDQPAKVMCTHMYPRCVRGPTSAIAWWGRDHGDGLRCRSIARAWSPGRVVVVLRRYRQGSWGAPWSGAEVDAIAGERGRAG